MREMKNETQKYARASFNCDKSVLDEFRRLVAQKHGRLWGVLNKEFEEALRQHARTLKEEIASVNG